MADIKVRFPLPPYTDPTQQVLMTLVDQGDGTFAPKIASDAATASGAVATDAIWDAAGDLAIGVGANSAVRLAIGTSGKILTSNGTTATWEANAGGAPTDVDYLVKTASAGLSAEIAIGAGSSGQILTSDGTNPSWGEGPLTTTGDLLLGRTAAAPARLAVGTSGQIVQSDGTNPTWADKSVTESQIATTDVTTGDATTTKHGLLKKLGVSGKILQSDGTNQQWVTEPAADLVAAAGDLLYGSAADTLAKLAIGTSGKVLASDGTVPTWSLPPGYEIDYATKTTSVIITGSNETSATLFMSSSSVALTAVPHIIEVYVPEVSWVSTVDWIMVVLLYEDSTCLGRIGTLAGEPATDGRGPFLARRRHTPSAATHQYHVKAWKGTGTTLSLDAGAGGVDVLMPAYIRITTA